MPEKVKLQSLRTLLTAVYGDDMSKVDPEWRAMIYAVMQAEDDDFAHPASHYLGGNGVPCECERCRG